MSDSVIAHPARTARGRRRLAAAGYAVLAVGFFSAGFLLAPTPEMPDNPQPDVERIRLPRPLPIGEFTLDVVGAGATRTYTRDRLLGQWTLMYFGYRHCPDLCRPALAVLSEVARELAAHPRRPRLERVFVTVDPARDTPARLRDYASSADAGIVALRGSDGRTAVLARQVGILYTPDTPDAGGSYLVDHPATILLIDPDARLRAGFPPPHDPAYIVQQILDMEQAFSERRAD